MHDARRPWAGYLLGLSLGGFMDGILLHQILQWHHLLQGVQGESFRQLRTQILADGLFHALMYVIALAGLWSLWRSRQSSRLSGRRLAAAALIGFGAWHILDGVLSHWVLGIHRIRMDSPNPLLWDLLWFFGFGVIPLLLGIALHRRAATGEPPAARRAAMAGITAAVIAAAPIAALPPEDARQVAVLVRPSDVNRLLDGLVDVGGGILWADRSGALWVFAVAEDAEPSRLYAHGALLVTRSPAALGCAAWL